MTMDTLSLLRKLEKETQNPEYLYQGHWEAIYYEKETNRRIRNLLDDLEE